MGTKYLCHGSGLVEFPVGANPETVRQLMELRKEFEAQKTHASFRIRRWLGSKLPPVRPHIDPTFAFEREEALLLKREREEEEASQRRLEEYLKSHRPAA
jgi:hypothetical protein